MNRDRVRCLLALCVAASPWGVPQVADLDFFPVVTQFSPVPSGEGWKGEEGPLSEEVLRGTLDNIRAHGFTGIEAPTHRPPNEEAFILEYAQSKGMIVTYHAGALELFGRTAPPGTCVYSPAYAEAVRANAEKRLAPLKDVPRLYNAFTYQDEPFHWGPQSFGYGEEVRAEFQRRYGYELPPDLDSIRDDPRKWLDVINFRSANFPDGWRQVYEIVKDINPNFKAILTHDSHNTFGAGYSSHCEIAIDDIFHWGGDFADMFVFDIYPYMMFDFRFGRPAQLPKPRMSQMHYSFAQMRNLTRNYGKDLGFWVGTYNPAWFKAYLCPELAAMHWTEREMSMTAVAHGADYLLTGYKIPVDAGHWESLGKGLQLLQKAGANLLDAPKVRAKACMLFPRTQYIQLQHEYFNVGLSFELFLRAFGELDILHEEQVTDDTLEGYEILVLFDVELLPEDVAAHIASFVRNGGKVVADCVPRMGAYKEPMPILEELFGVKEATGGRITRMGHWVPAKNQAPFWANRPEVFPDESVYETDTVKASALGVALDFPLVSPRPCTVTNAEVLAKTVSGTPVVLRREVGEGHAFLLGFCLQDTYFKTWEDENEAARTQLRQLLRAMTQDAGVQPHVCSTNPAIEAAVRANDKEGFLFVINHEAQEPQTSVQLRKVGFKIGKIVNLGDGEALSVDRTEDGATELNLSVPLGEVQLLHLLPGEDSTPGVDEETAVSTFTLWQLPNQTSTQIMSYVMRTRNGKVIVVDGGMEGDAPYLAKFIEGLGGKVEAWIVTHVHRDHFHAFREILTKHADIEIAAIYGSVPDQEWVDQFGNDGERESQRLFNQALADTGRVVTELALGQELMVDGLRFEVLGVKNPEITANPINNSSLVFRVADNTKSVLFLGDLGVQGGEKLLKSPLAGRLPADYVQMAHHGQNGVDEAFYRHVNPSYCLWPTPKWLWENDNGGGKGSGPWRTLEVRAWMEKLPVKAHYVMCEGLQQID